MKFITFFKPDLKKIIVLLIICCPYLLTLIFYNIFGIENIDFLNVLAFIVIIPSAILYLLLFGGFDYTFIGLFPSLAETQFALVIFYSSCALFWYIISCVIINGWSERAIIIKTWQGMDKARKDIIIGSIFASSILIIVVVLFFL
jgi:hypothetical protein